MKHHVVHWSEQMQPLRNTKLSGKFPADFRLCLIDVSRIPDHHGMNRPSKIVQPGQSLNQERHTLVRRQPPNEEQDERIFQLVLAPKRQLLWLLQLNKTRNL